MQITFIEIVKQYNSKGIKDKRKKGVKYILSYIGIDGKEYRKGIVTKKEFEPVLKGDNAEITNYYNSITL